MRKQSKLVPLNEKLCALIGDRNLPQDQLDLLGIEIELEGFNIVTTLPSIRKFWAVRQDGSLRIMRPGAQCIEYVLGEPSTLEQTKIAINKLYDYLTKTLDVEVFDSYRTSIHVHINFVHDTLRTLYNFVTLAIIFDDLFVSLNGETRQGNNFCLRSTDAEGQIRELTNSLTKYGSLLNISGQNRYSSVNFSSLRKFGTIEFRSLECTTDRERLFDWINVILLLKQHARTYRNPQEIVSKFSQKGPFGFMMNLLGYQYKKYAAVPDAQSMLRRGMRLAQDFAFCTSWEPDNYLPIKSKPDKLSNDEEIVVHQQAQQGPDIFEQFEPAEEEDYEPFDEFDDEEDEELDEDE